MKTSLLPLLAVGIAATSLFTSGCIYVRSRPAPETVSVTTAYSPGYVATTLPSGYTTTIYRGTRFYTYRGVYYRSHRRGYVVVTRPD